MAWKLRPAVLVMVLWLMVPVPAAAQESSQDLTLFEGHLGQGWFFDESPIRHDVVGLGISRTATSRVWLKGTLVHMRGPGSDRDLLLMGHVAVDLVRRSAPAVPFVAVGAGLMRHTNNDYGRRVNNIGPVALVTVGVRVRVSDRWSVAPEAAIGLGPQAQLGISFGIRK